MFLRAPGAVGLYCCCHVAHMDKGNFQKTHNKTLGACCRPRQFVEHASFSFLSVDASTMPVSGKSGVTEVRSTAAFSALQLMTTMSALVSPSNLLMKVKTSRSW